MALVAWVVPSITRPTRRASSPSCPRTAASASRMPVVTSALVGCLVQLRTWLRPSRTTASVLVPPTSIPIRRSRRSGVDTGDLRHGHVLDVVTEGRRTGDLQAPGGAPQGVAGPGQHAHPLPVPEGLGRDGTAGL